MLLGVSLLNAERKELGVAVEGGETCRRREASTEA